MTDTEKKIAEIRRKSVQGKIVQVQAGTVHELLSDIRFLLSELERLEHEYAEEREKMIKALKFYANEDNWRSTRFVVGRAEADSGQTAQDVLKKIGVTVE